jgi:hypothetical protein
MNSLFLNEYPFVRHVNELDGTWRIASVSLGDTRTGDGHILPAYKSQYVVAVQVVLGESTKTVLSQVSFKCRLGVTQSRLFTVWGCNVGALAR